MEEMYECRTLHSSKGMQALFTNFSTNPKLITKPGPFLHYFQNKYYKVGIASKI